MIAIDGIICIIWSETVTMFILEGFLLLLENVYFYISFPLCNVKNMFVSIQLPIICMHQYLNISINKTIFTAH